MKRNSWAVVAAATLWAAPVFAQEDGDVPEKGVARISLINGDVKVRHGDSGDETAGAVNAPLLGGDRLSTDASSRAEVQFDFANVLRLGPMTEVRMGELADRRYEVQIAMGMVMVRVMRDNQANFEINTPSVSVRPTRRGSYRITVFPDGSSEITARSGETEVFTPRGSEVLRAGKTMRARGDAADPEFQVANEAPLDEFDQWNTNRDRDLDRSVSSRYVPADVYGVEPLDAYGSWVYDAPYGWVWVPRVDPGWAPYRVGRWSYVNYYGWTWLSGDPWGWAPYHWGRWYQGARGWSWYPGAFGPRYYWRPALVAFFGWGSGNFNLGVGFGGGWGFGNLGWVPLAPYEVYRPWYGRWGGGRNNITIVNNTNITNIYRNARFNGGRGGNGITSVRSGDFGRGRIDDGNFVRAGERDLRNVGDVRGGVPFEPNGDSRRYVDRNVDARSFPRSDENRQFFRRGNSPAANVNADPGNRRGPSFAGGAVDPGPTRGNVRTGGDTPVAGPVDAGGGNRGFRRFGAPDTGNTGIANGGGSGGFDRGSLRQGGEPDNAPRTDGRGNNGWRRFDPSTNTSPRNRGGDVSIAPPSADRGFRSAQPDAVGNPRSRGGFRGEAPANPTQDGWRVFDGRNGARAAQPLPQPVPESSPRTDGGFSRRNRGDFSPAPINPPAQSFPQFSSPRMRGNQQPVQISPPIVRDRGNFNRGGGGGGGDIGRRSMSSGGFGSARPMGANPAPRGGGGGGDGRAEGGGGGPRNRGR